MCVKFPEHPMTVKKHPPHLMKGGFAWGPQRPKEGLRTYSIQMVPGPSCSAEAVSVPAPNTVTMVVVVMYPPHSYILWSLPPNLFCSIQVLIIFQVLIICAPERRVLILDLLGRDTLQSWHFNFL